MSDNQVAMARADGGQDSEVHLDGCILKPDENGVVLVPAQHVLSLLGAGYFWASLKDTTTRNSAQTNS